MPVFPNLLLRRRLMMPALVAVAVTAVACGGGDATPAAARPAQQAATTAPSALTTPTSESGDTSVEPAATATVVPLPPELAKPTGPVEVTLEGSQGNFARRFQLIGGWFTDFNQKTVDLGEITFLLPRDRIVPVDEPTFARASEAPAYLSPREPVIALKINGDVRAYPLAILMWHEIANDVVGGVPVTVTFCPLCNTAITFDRRVNGQELTFGTSGNLRNSDLVMWDRQTESWWQQITGEAIVGVHAGIGSELKVINSPIIAWETFAEEYPDGLVMERIFDSRGFPIRAYDDPPYAGYDNVDETPFAFTGVVDGRLPATSRVLAVEIGDATVAYPFSFLKESPVVNDRVAGTDVVAFFDDGTLSAFLDGRFQDQTSGSTTLFDRTLDGQTLTFTLSTEGITDLETGSTWSITGRATAGPLEGRSLDPIVHANHFWFAWAVFQPNTEIRGSVDTVVGPAGQL